MKTPKSSNEKFLQKFAALKEDQLAKANRIKLLCSQEAARLEKNRKRAFYLFGEALWSQLMEPTNPKAVEFARTLLKQISDDRLKSLQATLREQLPALDFAVKDSGSTPANPAPVEPPKPDTGELPRGA